MQKKIFGPKGVEITRDGQRLHNGEIYGVQSYPSPNIIKATKGRRMKWAGFIARMGGRRFALRLLMGSPEENKYLEDLGV